MFQSFTSEPKNQKKFIRRNSLTYITKNRLKTKKYDNMGQTIQPMELIGQEIYIRRF